VNWKSVGGSVESQSVKRKLGSWCEMAASLGVRELQFKERGMTVLSNITHFRAMHHSFDALTAFQEMN
jgi:hypothetical protein